MSTQLSSLRVAVDGDSTSYVQAMQAVATANNNAASSAARVGAAIDGTNSSLNDGGATLARLSKSYVTGWGAAAQFEAAVKAVQRGLDTGNLSLAQADPILAGISQKFGLVADAGALAAKGFDGVAAVAETVNARLASQTVAVTGAAAGFELIGGKLVKAQSSSSGMANALETMNRQVLALATGLGPTGVILAGFGPWGLAAAAAVSAAASAFEALSAGADDLARKATALQSFAQTTGLSTDSIQALNEQGEKFGLTSESVSRSVETFASAVGQAQQGSGQLFDSLLKTNPALALQVSGAHDVATAFNLVATAYQSAANAGNPAGAAAIARAAFGRGGSAAGPALLGAASAAGGIDQLGTDAKTSGDAIDASLIPRLVALQSQLTLTKERATDMTESLFAEDVLTAELQFYQGMDKVVQVLTRLQQLSNSLPSATKGIGAGLVSLFGVAGAIPAAILSLTKPTAPTAAPANDNGMADLGVSVSSLAGLGGGEASLTASSAALYAVQQKLIGALAGTATPAQQLQLQLLGLKKATDDHTLSADQAAKAQGLLVESFNVTQLQANVSAMGALASPTQIYAAAVAELKLKLDESKISQGAFNVGVVAAQQAMNSSTESIREQLGIASSADIATQKYTDMSNALTKIGASTSDWSTAQGVVARQVQQTADSMAVLRSSTPNFTQLILDLQNANKVKDELLTSSGNALLQAAPAFLQALQQGQTISQAIASSLTGAANSIANAFADTTDNEDDDECDEFHQVQGQDRGNRRHGGLRLAWSNPRPRLEDRTLHQNSGDNCDVRKPRGGQRGEGRAA